MMEPFETIDIQELPLSVPTIRRQVEDFLGSNGLRLGEVDLYLAVLSEEGAILAGGGLHRDILKCLAVSAEARSLGLSVPLISRLISVASERGYTNVKVFTKPENRSVFESLGFKLLAEAPKAILMENGRGLEEYCQYLCAHQAPGVIIINANPFTLGHRYLVEQASLSFRAPEGRRNLTIIPVKEDASRFPYSERLEMIRTGSGDRAYIVEGSDYQISAATFPTYFLKNLSDAAETQMRLDIDLFGRHIAPALGAQVRFVGTEPADPLTARYNALMKELLPKYGVQLVEIQRLTCSSDCSTDSSTSPSASLRMTEGPLTATKVRALLDAGQFKAASALTPESTWPYLLADLAERALKMELDTPLKPGLVGPDSVGAHKDMDYDVMRKGIAAIRPFFARMAMAGTPDELRQLGIDAEAAMLAATGGVNTHRGAIFAQGLALYRHPMAETAARLDNGASKRREAGIRGAMQMAKDGYKELFEDWLPYYRSIKAEEYGLQKTLLRIMATLDDTCVIHRVGYERAMAVKDEAKALLKEIPGQAGNDEAVMADLIGHLKEMCESYAAEGISPGGAADMLALTIFIDSIFN